LKIMTRHTTTLASPSSLWGLGASLRGLSRLVSASFADASGLLAVERESARIRLSGRHWLM
jgi:hypothetical protein